MFKWFQKNKQKRKIKLIKRYLTIINVINLLIKKIENFKIKFIKITIYLEDINLFFYNFNQFNLENSNEEKYSFQTKKEAINLLKAFQTMYQKEINKIIEKYENLMPLLNEKIETNEAEELLLAKMIKSTITVKNKNNDLIKINLHDSIDNIAANLLIAENESDNNNDSQSSNQQTATTLSSYIYHDNTPSTSQQHLIFSSTENLISKENNDDLTKKDLTSKIKKLII